MRSTRNGLPAAPSSRRCCTGRSIPNAGRRRSIINRTNITASVGFDGLLSLVIALLSVTFAWYVVQGINLDKWLKQPRGPQARMLQLLLAVVLGHGLARFILDYLEWTRMLRWIVE